MIAKVEAACLAEEKLFLPRPEAAGFRLVAFVKRALAVIRMGLHTKET